MWLIFCKTILLYILFILPLFCEKLSAKPAGINNCCPVKRRNLLIMSWFLAFLIAFSMLFRQLVLLRGIIIISFISLVRLSVIPSDKC
jgi:hypothetical protein